MKRGGIRKIEKEVLSEQFYTLNRYTFEYEKEDGTWELQRRESYDRGNGVAILLYNPGEQKVILTRQFRIPTYVNGNEDGMMVEVCAGMLDEKDPEACIRREVEEETGYRIGEVKKVFEAYMSPGAVTEILHFFIAPYDETMKAGPGGGAEGETENIEVLEISYDEAFRMIDRGEIRDAKSLLLLQYARLQGLI
ncbi:NUDIX domain-containing protein [Muriicola marianensis]|nr:NUDIX domain-containing protein [Muriicola marianensis]